MRSFVITGGPGSGKSTLLQALAGLGYHTVREVSRELIRAQVAAGTSCLPWLDLPCFARRCSEKMRTDFREAASATYTFFDRGLPDILAYLNVGGKAIDPALLEACKMHRYETKVFITPPWEEIYINDNERWQTFAEACALDEGIRRAYKAQGYQLVTVPRMPVGERVGFIIKNIAE